jgi:hypothetical protein
MDCLTELEVALGNFTQALYQGINEIQEKSGLDQNTRNKLITDLSTEILNSHTNIMNVVGKIPNEIFTKTREEQEAEIRNLEMKYENSLHKLENLKEKAEKVFKVVEDSLDKV